jgi:FkbM family methyltransferase
VLEIHDDKVNDAAAAFCDLFANSSRRPRFILGRNEYAASIAILVDVTGIIDDFTTEKDFMGKPVVRMRDVPRDSLVVSSVLGKPGTVALRLDSHGLTHLDYFSFSKYSGLDVMPVKFWNEFKEDFDKNRDKYEWIYDLLRDDESKATFSRIVHFRLHMDLAYMDTFKDRQRSQYFEIFLGLRSADETFVDVGGFDGNTSLEFIRRCPGYKSVHLFEPDQGNFAVARARLSPYRNIRCHAIGLSDRRRRLCFQPGGSTARISEQGIVTIDVDAMDNVIGVDEHVSFVKMDIEGGEGAAIDGARKTIMSSRPKLAICVYHKADDLWKLPQKVLSIHGKYDLYLRHYTEGVDETVMFFVPE